MRDGAGCGSGAQDWQVMGAPGVNAAYDEGVSRGLRAAWVWWLAGCGAAGSQSEPVEAAPGGGGRDGAADVVVEADEERVGGGDLDGDGIEDGEEDRLARAWLPYLSDDPGDACGVSGIVVRVRPHPGDPALVSIVYVRLYNEDCGLNGHVGDDEVFGVVIDPRASPGAEGVLRMVAIGHQDTVCEQTTSCGRCVGDVACETTTADGRVVPVVFASRDKHANYVVAARCSWISCLDSCTLAPRPSAPPLVNAGEPGRPRVSNLSAQGFVTRANGWTHAALFDVDPWDRSKQFGGGGAGNVASRLLDESFVPPVCPRG